MKYYLEAGHAFDNASIETDCFCETVEDVEKENYEFGFLDDLLIEANQQWDEKPQGYFSLREAEEKVYSKAKQYIKELEPQLKILSKEVDEDGRVIRSKEILIYELVWKLLEEDYFNSDYYARVSWYVEACIRAFEDEAVWLVGICNSQGEVIDDPAFLEEAEWQDGDWLFNGREYHSLIWYGLPKSKPILRWTINENTSQSDLKFWFSTDTYSLMKELGDFDESFLYWYDMELGFDGPNMKKIRESCPISFEETDSINKILNKVDLYLWNKIHS